MRRKYQPADSVRLLPEHGHRRPADVPADAVATVIAFEDVPVMGPGYRINILYPGQLYPTYELAAYYGLVKAAPSRTAAELRAELTAARQDITDASDDPDLPPSEMARLRWRARQLSGQLELAEKAERVGAGPFAALTA